MIRPLTSIVPFPKDASAVAVGLEHRDELLDEVDGGRVGVVAARGARNVRRWRRLGDNRRGLRHGWIWSGRG